MNLKFNSSKILIFLLIQSVLSFENSVDLKVGVSPFKNLNDNDFGNHLSLVLNSTLESALNQRYQIPIVERASLGELLSEEALQANSNSFDILPIDYLIVGSYSGNESNMVVIIKMLDAKSTLSKYQTRLNGNLQQVMEQLYLVAGNISDELKGKNKSASQGFLTLKGEPKGASVYEGNKLIGTIPIL